MAIRGSGSLRRRGPGRWEVRVSLGPHAVSGRSVYRSVTVHGDLAQAEHGRALLAAQATHLRRARVVPVATVGELLARWLGAEHDTRRRRASGPRLLTARDS